MKSTLRLLFSIFVLVLAGVPVSQAQGTRQLTATLLPVQTQAAKAGPAGFLWIRQSTDKTVDPEKDVFLQFDLSALPAGLAEKDIRRATLRLVALNVVYQHGDDPDSGGTLISVKGQMAKADFSGVQNANTIVALSTLTRANTVAQQAAEALRKAVYQQYSSADRKLSLRLFSESHKSSTLFYSPASFGTSPSNIPRLVIEYTLPPPALPETLGWSQHQHDPEHSGRNSWAPFQNPSGFSLSKIDMPGIGGQSGSIADYPLIHEGNLYLIYKVLDINYLMAFDFRGIERWRRDIGKGTVQRSPVISRDGTFYAVTEDKISAYDLHATGRLKSSYSPFGKLSDFTDLTIGNDGSLYLAAKENDLNFIYGYTPELKPFLKSGPFGKGAEKISTVTVSADGQQVFAQIPGGAVTINVVDPARVQKVRLTYDTTDAWEYYHVPIAGPAGGAMVFSDFTSLANKGNVWGSTASRRIWSSAGSLLPQPVLGSNGLVYFVQDGALQAHRYDQVGAAAINKADGLNTTSNLVMDGAGNIYFWDNGTLHGRNLKGERLFETVNFSAAADLEKSRLVVPATAFGSRGAQAPSTAAGPEQFVRLMLGPDGTLWANNRNGNALYAFTPRYAVSDPTLVQKLESQTVYRATGVLTVDKAVTIPAGSKILFQAKQGISFPAGFAVERGASLLSRTGF